MFPLLLLAAPGCRGQQEDDTVYRPLACVSDRPVPFGTTEANIYHTGYFKDIEFETSVEKVGNGVGHAADQTAPLDVYPGDNVTLTLKIKNTGRYRDQTYNYVIMALEVAPRLGYVEIGNDKFEARLPDTPAENWYTLRCEGGVKTVRKSAIVYFNRFTVEGGSEATFSAVWTAPPFMDDNSQYFDLGFISTICVGPSHLHKKAVGRTLRYWPPGVTPTTD